MRRPAATRARSAVGLGGGALLLLTACAGPAESSVDLDAARAWLETVQAEQSDGPGAAGTASILVGTDPDGEASGVRLDFENPTALKRADARCFGGGTVDIAVTVYSADGASTDSLAGSLPCDEQPHDVDLAAAPSPASAALIEAHGSDETYLHVVLIEEMVVER